MKILLQTTIPQSDDDWSIDRFSLLREHIASQRDEDGRPVEVVARNREPDARGDDPLLRAIDTSDFDQVWLFAVDTGDGISADECAAFTRFRNGGGHLFVTRDHQDLGSSICSMGEIGSAHFFHSQNLDPEEANRVRDDNVTMNIDWPNYHSGANGDVQVIEAVEPVHPLLRADGRVLQRFPAHPHEGAVGKPADAGDARVIARGTSRTTRRPFNIAVAFEGDERRGRGLAESTFHHFCDYNWDVSKGCPSFVEEPPSDRIANDHTLLHDIKAYVANIVAWFGARKATATAR